MDIAYDRVLEKNLPEHVEKEERSEKDASGGEASTAAGEADNNALDIRSELSQTYQAFTQSAWGARLGGLWASAKKQTEYQGESYYETAARELSQASAEASKDSNGFIASPGALNISNPEIQVHSVDAPKTEGGVKEQVPESLTADIAKEARSIFATFRSGANARLKQVQAAEDAADEALLRFGSNIFDFLRDSVKITGPEDASGQTEVLFESRDVDGKRVVHATRFDAQLHVIHSTMNSFTKDPESDEFGKWKTGFDIEKKTDAIAADLQKYPELRRAMEKLVPEQVEYPAFWTRYYFLRHVIETEEQKRRELLKSTQTQEEVSWDDDDEEEDVKTPNNGSSSKAAARGDGAATPKKSDADLLKPSESRRSNEHSVADSDTSYDIVSGATSRAPGSPKEDKDAAKKPGTVAEESDDDWE